MQVEKSLDHIPTTPEERRVIIAEIMKNLEEVEAASVPPVTSWKQILAHSVVMILYGLAAFVLVERIFGMGRPAYGYGMVVAAMFLGSFLGAVTWQAIARQQR